MPTVLDDALLTDTLLSLPGWQGGREGIWRETHLTAELDAELRRQVSVDSASMGHEPVVENVAGGTRFTLSTQESGGVTELDISLAAHISDLVHRLSSDEPGINAVRSGDPVVLIRGADEEADTATSEP